MVHTSKQLHKAHDCLCAFSLRATPCLLESRVWDLIHFASAGPAVWICGDEWMIVLLGDPFRACSKFPRTFPQFYLGHLFSFSASEEPNRRENLLFDFQRCLHHLESGWGQLWNLWQKCAVGTIVCHLMWECLIFFTSSRIL